VPRRALAGAKLGRQRFDAHLLHERTDVTSSHLHACLPQLATQHPCAHEGMFQMRFIDPAH